MRLTYLQVLKILNHARRGTEQADQTTETGKELVRILWTLAAESVVNFIGTPLADIDRPGYYAANNGRPSVKYIYRLYAVLQDFKSTSLSKAILAYNKAKIEQDQYDLAMRFPILPSTHMIKQRLIALERAQEVLARHLHCDVNHSAWDLDYIEATLDHECRKAFYAANPGKEYPDDQS